MSKKVLVMYLPSEITDEQIKTITALVDNALEDNGYDDTLSYIIADNEEDVVIGREQ